MHYYNPSLHISPNFVIMEVDIVHFMNVNENFGRALKNDDVSCRMEDDTAGVTYNQFRPNYQYQIEFKDLVRLLHDTADNHQLYCYCKYIVCIKQTSYVSYKFFKP